MSAVQQARTLLRAPFTRFVVIGVVVVAWAWFLGTQLEGLRSYSWQIGAGSLLLATACGAAYFLGLAVCWTWLLRSVAGATGSIALAAGVRVWTSSMLSRYVPGNIWHLLGRVAFAGSLGVSKGQVLASAAVEQLLTLVGAAAVFALSVPFWRGSPGAYLWLLLLVPVALLLLHPRLSGPVVALAARLLRRPELAWRYSYGEIVGIVAAYTAANLASGLALLVVLGALAPVDAGAGALVIGVSGLAWAVGYLSFLTPSGLGVREAVLAALLAQIVPLPVAAVGSLIYRLVLSVGEVVAVGVALLYSQVRNEATKEQL